MSILILNDIITILIKAGLHKLKTNYALPSGFASLPSSASSYTHHHIECVLEKKKPWQWFTTAAAAFPQTPTATITTTTTIYNFYKLIPVAFSNTNESNLFLLDYAQLNHVSKIMAK